MVEACIDLAVPGRPIRSLVAEDRPGWAPGLPGDDTGGARPHHWCAGRPDRPMAEQIAADLLPEAGDSWAVEGGEGL